MLFILHTSKEGKLTLYPNKTNTPKELLSDSSEIDIPTDKEGLMSFIQDMLDRIPPQQEEEAENKMPPEPAPVSNTDTLVSFEDQWEEFPLARKLHFASLAVEEARDTIKPRKEN